MSSVRTPRFAAGVICALGGVLALAAVRAQNPPSPQPQRPVFRGGANYVLVDAYPKKDGQIVEGLTANDFQIFEDGKPQTIDSVEFVRVQPEMAEATRRDPNNLKEMYEAAADPHNRVFVVFLDVRHTTVDGSHNIRAPLVTMLNRLIGPTDLFGVTTDHMRATDLTLGRRTLSIEEQLTKYWTWGERYRVGHDPNDQGEQDLETCFHVRQTPNGFEDWIIDDGPVRRFLDDILIERRREDLTLRSLEDLVAHLGDMREARTSVVVVTDGWLLFNRAPELEAQPPRDVRSTAAIVPRVGDSPIGANRGGMYQVGWAQCVSELNRLAELQDGQRFKQLITSANRANVSIYPITARGLQPFDNAGAAERIMPNMSATNETILGRDQDRLASRVSNLRTIAENTDGIAIVQTNDLAGGVKTILNDLTAYYLIGYYSTNQKFDGKLRRIEVKMKTPGLTVHARRGYLAPNENAKAGSGAAAVSSTPATPTAIDDALGGLGRLRESAETYLYAVPSGKDVVTVVEIAGRQPTPTTPIAVKLELVSENGTRIGETSGTIDAGARSAIVRVATNGSAGPWQVTSHVKSGALSLDDRLLVSPTSAHIVGEPVVFRAATPPRAPLRAAAEFIFHRTERVHVDWPMLKPLDQRTARLLDRRGQPLAVNVTVSEREVEGAQVVAADLSLAPLSDGDYVIELTVGSGAETERKLIAIRVVR